MSYILDALRKADAQRERDPARGIHAQPVLVTSGESRLNDGNRVGFWAASAAGLAALASVAGWYFFRDGGAVPVTPPVQAEVAVVAPAPAVAVAPPAAPAAAVLPPPAVAPPPVVVAPPIAAIPPVVKAPPVAGPAPAVSEDEPEPGARVGRSFRSSSRAAAAALAAPAQAPTANAPAQAAAPNAPAAAEAAPVVGLPADAPKLAISGGVYSTNSAQRMLIVNGQVFNEGVEVGAGVMLEEIKPKAAVLRFRGSRYTVAY